jgi:hypothetical protein
MIDFQSSATALRLCPSGTSENSQQHARVIYGWVHRSQQIQNPAGMTEILLGLSSLKYPIHVYRYRFVVEKRSKLRNEPNFRGKLLSFSKKHRKNFRFYDKRNSSITRAMHISPEPFKTF